MIDDYGIGQTGEEAAEGLRWKLMKLYGETENQG